MTPEAPWFKQWNRAQVGNRGQVTPQQTPDITGHRLRSHSNHIEKASNPVPVGKGRIRRWHRLVEWMVSG